MMSVLLRMWMEWGTRDEETAKAENSFVRQLAESAAKYARRGTGELTDESGTADNPFPDIMREGASGVISG